MIAHSGHSGKQSIPVPPKDNCRSLRYVGNRPSQETMCEYGQSQLKRAAYGWIGLGYSRAEEFACLDAAEEDIVFLSRVARDLQSYATQEIGLSWWRRV